MIDQMVGRRIFIRYDSDRPEWWFIPDEKIEGCRVEQKMGSHLIHDYSPNG